MKAPLFFWGITILVVLCGCANQSPGRSPAIDYSDPSRPVYDSEGSEVFDYDEHPEYTPSWDYEPEEEYEEVAPEDETGCPYGCDTPPSGCAIKGNISVETGERIYHMPGQKWYAKTNISPEYGEAWFCTEREAQANGFRKSYE